METELKFQVPAARSAALQRAVHTATATSLRLQAVYVDTDDQRLAKAGLALRLRKEGRRWVQTLKGRADAEGSHGLMDRLEHEVGVPAAAVDPHHPMPDPARHLGTPAGERLQAALGTPPAELKLLYRTDVRRLKRHVRHRGATIEIAHDRGRLLSDRGSAAVDEFELELVAGPPAALVDLSQRWAARFGLWWDSRTKSERGMRLALGIDTVPAVHAIAVHGGAAADAAQVGSAALQAALAQALPNASELAAGSGNAEHLHQLRVALRRLRTLLRMWAPGWVEGDRARALEAAWREPFGVLGAARDADVRSQMLWPALQAAGAPEVDWPTPVEAPDAAACIRGPVFTDLMLRTLSLTLQSPAGVGSKGSGAAAAVPVDLATAARHALKPAWTRILRDAQRFPQTDVQAQHRTRKRLKRLRYLLEVLQPLYPRRATRRLLKSVRRALNALGDLNDLQSAQARCRELAANDPRAWFAVGWLAAQHDPAITKASHALKELKAAPRVWKQG